MTVSAHAVGICKSLSPARQVICDLLYFARRVPLCPIERHFDVAALGAARQATFPRIGWAAVFLKAYALAAAEWPQLRQAYLSWPWPHVYEHPLSVAMLAVNRQEAGEDQLYFGRFIEPEKLALAEIQDAIDRYKHEPLETVFRKQLRFGKLPTFLRRGLWWWNLNVSGASRARRLGTFGMSTLAAYNALNRQHPSCLATSLTYGPVEADGRMLVTVLYDHRLVDGAPMGRMLQDLEAILNGEITAELRQLGPHVQAA
jgi:hypothetical protein